MHKKWSVLYPPIQEDGPRPVLEEVGEVEGGVGQGGGRQVVAGEGEDPVEGREAKGGKQSRVDLVPQTSHLPEILLLPGLESSPNFT